MRKLLLILCVAVGILAVSCDPNSSTNDNVDALTLTSSATIRADKKGGTEYISYNINGQVSGELSVKVINEELITAVDTTTPGIIALTISENPTQESREGAVSVSYASSAFSVKVLQEGNPDAPTDVVSVRANQFRGQYFGDRLGSGKGQYWIILSDNGFDSTGAAKVGGEFFRAELVGPVSADPFNARVPNGVYEYDLSNSLSLYTILSLGNSDYTVVDEYLEGWATSFVSATLTVNDNLFTLEAVVPNEISGENIKYVVTFQGEYTLGYEEPKEQISTLKNDLTIDLSDCVGSISNYGNGWYCGYCNWYLLFEDKDGWNQGEYLVVELLSDSNLDGTSGFVGKYEGLGVDSEDSTLPLFGPYSFVAGHRIAEGSNDFIGSIWMRFSNGSPVEQAPLRGGEVNITENSDGTYTIVIDATDDADPAHKISLNWTGRL